MEDEIQELRRRNVRVVKCLSFRIFIIIYVIAVLYIANLICALLYGAPAETLNKLQQAQNKRESCASEMVELMPNPFCGHYTGCQ